jgi:hypothetical protein
MMSKALYFLQRQLKPGKVYRRADLAQWSKAVDRHLGALVKEGTIEKLSPGVYYVPRKTVFGSAPPDEHELVRAFLKDDEFLLTSPNAYNSLGLGTTQLYNKRVVYNHKRHGTFNLGGRVFLFHAKHRFPTKLSQEFLLVDLLNNIQTLAEDREAVMKLAMAKAKSMDPQKLSAAVKRYGKVRTKALLEPTLIEAAHEA